MHNEDAVEVILALAQLSSLAGAHWAVFDAQRVQKFGGNRLAFQIC